MNQFYNFICGPLAWLSFAIFVFGIIFELRKTYLLAQKKERMVFSFFSIKYSIRSVFRWLVPFGTTSMRKHPFLTVVSFVFHFCILAAPLFALPHIILIEEATGLSWFHISDHLINLMTLMVVGSCVFFLVRRIVVKEVRFISTRWDYIFLLLVSMPFTTGFLAYHQWINYQLFMILHVLSAELLMIIIPFTRLGHMIFAAITRAYTGSEFGSIRHAKDW